MFGDKIYVSKSISEEGWVIHLSLDGAGLEIPLDQAQDLVKDLIEEFKEIMELEEDINGEETMDS